MHMRYLPSVKDGRGSTKGIVYTQIAVHRTDEKNKSAAVYKVEKEGVIPAYEVFIIKIKKQSEAFGVVFDESEVYPCDESFGKTAWSYHKLCHAMDKFTEITGI